MHDYIRRRACALQYSPDDDGSVIVQAYTEDVSQIEITPSSNTEISDLKIHICGEGKLTIRKRAEMMNCVASFFYF